MTELLSTLLTELPADLMELDRCVRALGQGLSPAQVVYLEASYPSHPAIFYQFSCMHRDNIDLQDAFTFFRAFPDHIQGYFTSHRHNSSSLQQLMLLAPIVSSIELGVALALLELGSTLDEIKEAKLVCEFSVFNYHTLREYGLSHDNALHILRIKGPDYRPHTLLQALREGASELEIMQELNTPSPRTEATVR